MQIWDGPRRVECHGEVTMMEPLDYVSYGGPISNVVAPVYAKSGKPVPEFDQGKLLLSIPTLYNEALGSDQQYRGTSVRPESQALARV